MRGRIASVVLTGLLAGLLGWVLPAAENLVVVRNNSTFSVPIERERGYAAARAASLAEALGYTQVANSIRMDGEAAQFIPGSPFFGVGDEVYQLPNPVYRDGSHLMIPVSWALEWLPGVRSRQWRYMDGRLVERPPVTMRPPEREFWLVVIDAGHGGPDPGTIGVSGTREKDVTLAIAKQLERRLSREANIRVILTRDRDTLIALGDRPRIAHLRGIDTPPDLFVSIHGNSMPKKPHSMRGHETYFLAVAKTEQARRVAMRENESLQFESGLPTADPASLQFILSDLQSTGNLRESSLFATAVNRSMAMAVEAPDQGVRQGPFGVLVGATIPAVLVEVGYLSNRSEERQLRSSSYQAKIADALADAVVNYLAEYGRRVWSSYRSGG